MHLIALMQSKGLVLPDPYAIEENGEVVQPDEDMNELRSSAFVQDLGEMAGWVVV